MPKKLNTIVIPLNEGTTKAVSKELSQLVKGLSFTEVKEEQTDFSAMSQKLTSEKADIFIWEAEDIPDLLPEGLDFFLIPHLNAAVVFKENNDLLLSVRTYYCPPVAFIGGGPGNHEWLTLEAKFLLDRCDIVFYDALVNPLIVASLPEEVERFYVGKRGDSKSFNQDELNKLIADHAKHGFKVGRLKGGDPGILGRMTEEIDTLLKNKLSFTITPGISAMQAICTNGIHLTQRGICDRVTLTTARSAGGEINNLLPFKEASLIVYMGILSADKIMKQLLDAGYKEDLPAAILVNLTRRGQKVYHTSLGKLAETVSEANIRPPGLLVLGETARKDLHRVSPASPVNGRRVLLTSTSTEAIKASTRLRRWGATPVFLYRELMTIETETVLPEFDDVVFFTPREVSDFYEVLGGPKISGECNVISIGKEIDATFSCLFRRDSQIAKNYKEAVDLLRKNQLLRLLE